MLGMDEPVHGRLRVHLAEGIGPLGNQMNCRPGGEQAESTGSRRTERPTTVQGVHFDYPSQIIY